MGWTPSDGKDTRKKRVFKRKTRLPPQVQAAIDKAKADAKKFRPPAASRPRSTNIERQLKLCLMALKVQHKSQVKIGPYTADFLVGESLVLEADGPWHAVQRIRVHDLKRDRYLTGLGYRVVRFSYADLMEKSALDCVRAALGL